MPTQFHILSFEGPDPYARAGGLASRVDGLSRTLAELGYECHLWFVGDPDLPGHEQWEGVQLHRWCQWLSAGHRGGVYEAQATKHADFTASLPGWMVAHILAPHLAGDAESDAVVLAEEWQTVDAVIALDQILRREHLRDRISLLWNANNLFGFERIDWDLLSKAAVVTTVSRVMRSRMEPLGIRPLVLANGLPPEAFELPDRRAVNEFARRTAQRTALAKVARWDPAKSWLLAIESTARLRDEGMRPLLIARGGAEDHETEVRKVADRFGLRWADRRADSSGPDALIGALVALDGVDILCLRFLLDSAASRLLYRAADCVLANSRFEPFGLVGLETMAVAGVACTGLTGEDYATPGRNALVLQTEDPDELVGVLRRLQERPDEERILRRAARRTARSYAWREIVNRVLLPRLELLRRPHATAPRHNLTRGLADSSAQAAAMSLRLDQN